MQRLLVTQMTFLPELDKQHNVGMLINDWGDVQDDRYRYIAIDDAGQVVIRIVIAEYSACEVAWGLLRLIQRQRYNEHSDIGITKD